MAGAARREVKKEVSATGNSHGNINKLAAQDRSVHDWYRFVLSFPPHLVRQYIEQFGVGRGQRVLDPFCGTGTTLVECKKLGIESVGIEANRFACFASQVKVNWNVDPDALLKHAKTVGKGACAELETQGIEDNPALLGFNRRVDVSRLRRLPLEAEGLLLTDSISALPLHKTLVLLDHLKRLNDKRCMDHERLALAGALVARIGNLHFGPEVGVGPAKEDTAVVSEWLSWVSEMASDLSLQKVNRGVPAAVHYGDARRVEELVGPNSIDAVITSPPYPNEKDYTRTTRLESVILGFINDKRELQALKRHLVRSNTRNVYKGDDDDQWVNSHNEIGGIAAAIEARRVELGKTSGFEKLYAKVTKLYFGGMLRHLASLRPVLRPGAQLAYVVGDQASYLRVMIRTGQVLADLAGSLGYQVTGIDLFRTRLATATREHLREEVVLLRWPGP